MQSKKELEGSRDRITSELVQEALSDFRKEQEDAVEVAKAGFGDPALDLDAKASDPGKIKVKLMRPPRSSREAIQALQDADQRYSANK